MLYVVKKNMVDIPLTIFIFTTIQDVYNMFEPIILAFAVVVINTVLYVLWLIIHYYLLKVARKLPDPPRERILDVLDRKHRKMKKLQDMDISDVSDALERKEDDDGK